MIGGEIVIGNIKKVEFKQFEERFKEHSFSELHFIDDEGVRFIIVLDDSFSIKYKLLDAITESEREWI